MLDIYDDVELNVIKDKELPNFVKESSIKSKNEYERFAVKVAKQNGDVEHKCPIDDKASTWLSLEYYENAKDSLTKKARNIIGNKIEEACDRFGIDEFNDDTIDDAYENDIIKENNLYNNNQYQEKEGEFLFPEQKQYEVKDQSDIKKAANYFEEYENDFTLEEKRTYSENLVKAAEKYDAEIKNEDILKFSSETMGFADNFEKNMNARKEILHGDEESQSTVETLIEKKSEIPPSVMVELVEEFDKQAGLTNKWGRMIAEPDKTVNGIEKEVEKIAQSIAYKGESMTADDIRNIPESELEKYFNENQIEDLKDSPSEVFYALPDPHKEIIVDLI